MFRSIGFLIILWGLSLYFSQTLKSFDNAASATFKTVETAAKVSEAQINALEHKR